MARTRDEVAQSTLTKLKRLAMAMQRAAAPEWLQLDLTMSQIKGLFCLARQRGTPVGGLAAALGVGEASASLLLDKLVRLGLATRTEDPADRRRTLASLSEDGEEMVTRLRHGGRRSLEGWLMKLDHDDLAALDRGLAALASAAEADPGP